MENKLAENIRSYRKNRGLTQEQLAERLGITLGTVSKWERGSSEPDLGFLMDLAELFQVSVDALIGFSMRGNDADEEAERIKLLKKAVSAEAAAEEYENALKKFPNHFEIVYDAAECHMEIGIVYQRDDEIRRAQELYRHAIGLISQNRNPMINELMLRNDIAHCYARLNDHKRAVEEYKKNNPCGNNDAEIGTILIHDLKQPQEGIRYIVNAFINDMSDLITEMFAYILYYQDVGDFPRYIRTAQWMADYLRSLKDNPDEECYLDKIICLFLMTKAAGQDADGRTEEAAESLREAFRMAREFDHHPVYTLKNLFFADEAECSVYDNGGPTAIKSMQNTMKDVEAHTSESFRKLFKELLAEETEN